MNYGFLTSQIRFCDFTPPIICCVSLPDVKNTTVNLKEINLIFCAVWTECRCLHLSRDGFQQICMAAQSWQAHDGVLWVILRHNLKLQPQHQPFLFSYTTHEQNWFEATDRHKCLTNEKITPLTMYLPWMYIQYYGFDMHVGVCVSTCGPRLPSLIWQV